MSLPACPWRCNKSDRGCFQGRWCDRMMTEEKHTIDGTKKLFRCSKALQEEYCPEGWR